MSVKLMLLSLVVSLLFIGQVVGQGITVKGIVVSGEDKSPLIGANVVVKDTEMGASTDIDGLYIIENVPAEATLVVFYVGYQTTEVSVNSREQIDIRLTPEAISGEEVVVIGYGTQKREDVTNSIATLDEHAFNKGVTTDPQQLLAARIPGVTVTASSGDLGAEPVIRIRGGTSITASNNPMIVIDGVPVESVPATPQFERNGLGEDNPGTGLRDNPLATLNPNDIASIDILKDASAAAIYGARGGNGVILITTKSGQPGGLTLTYDGYTSISTQPRKYDLLNAAEFKAFADQVGAVPTDGGTSTDWQEAVVQDAIGQNHNISISAGSENTQYMFSASFLDEQGLIVGSDRQRISGRLNLSHKMLDRKLRLGLRMNPSYTKRNNAPFNQTGGFRGGLITNVLKYNPTQPVRNADGTFFHEANPDIRNPVAMAELLDDKSNLTRVFGNATAEYDISSGLTAKLNLGLDRSESTRGIYQPNSLPYAASFGGRADVASSSRQNVLFESTLNYRTEIGDNQSLEVWAGYSFQDFENSFFQATALDFVTDAFSFNNLSAGADFGTFRPQSSAADNRLVSFLGRAIYSLNNKYLINGAIRREGSSRFGDNNKWGTFPSVSVGWRLSEESFLQGGSLNDLKLRVSYGITGNQDITDYLSLQILGPGANAVIGGNVQTGISLTQLANPDLKWEETSQINVGLDFGLWNNRLAGSIDLYQKDTKDLLLDILVPQPAPVETQVQNIGEVKNTGIELTINTINVASSEFFWRSNVNFASNRNEVQALRSEGDFIIHGPLNGAGFSETFAQIIFPGQPLGTFFGPPFPGL